MPTRPFAALILAAGKGTRMKSDLHKVLHPIAGRPMLAHLLASVDALGPAAKVVVVGSGREQVEAAVAGPRRRGRGAGAAARHRARRAAGGGGAGGFEGDVLILYGDVPLVASETMARMLDRLHGEDAPAAVVLGFRPADTLAYGRVIARDGTIEKMVEHKDANTAERAETLCNSGLMAVRSERLWDLLKRVGNANAAGEYYLPDIVMLAAADGLASAVIETDPQEVAGINSRAELAAVEADWQARRRAQAMADGASLIAPDTVWFAHDTEIGRDVVIEPNVVFGPACRWPTGHHPRVQPYRGRAHRQRRRDRAVRQAPPRCADRRRCQGRQFRRDQEGGAGRGRQGQPSELCRRCRRSARGRTSARAPSPATMTGS
jgi:bifunctional UDP-N-acetylglucosamine pyrophosphorylase/glucosamine-1-phosphate N-acetyltransferase